MMLDSTSKHGRIMDPDARIEREDTYLGRNKSLVPSNLMESLSTLLMSVGVVLHQCHLQLKVANLWVGLDPCYIM